MEPLTIRISRAGPARTLAVYPKQLYLIADMTPAEQLRYVRSLRNDKPMLAELRDLCAPCECDCPRTELGCPHEMLEPTFKLDEDAEDELLRLLKPEEHGPKAHRRPPLPTAPLDALDVDERVERMRWRHENGQAIHHPRDRRFMPHEAIEISTRRNGSVQREGIVTESGPKPAA